uniref:Histone deacetylase complex subunit SAP18 n=1 Tax=Triticum urartu TaxID=4572 RepID=A0A8R7V8H9_TRIUA
MPSAAPSPTPPMRRPRRRRRRPPRGRGEAGEDAASGVAPEGRSLRRARGGRRRAPGPALRLGRPPPLPRWPHLPHPPRLLQHGPGDPPMHRGPPPMARPGPEPIDREKTCPLLLRVFTKVGGHHLDEEFSKRGKEPKDEVQIYTWMDATLPELIVVK